MRTTEVPRYDDLPLNETLGLRHAWGVFGKEDELGTLNFATDAAVRAAAAEIETGKRFCLSLPLNLPDPSWSKQRKPYTHHVYETRRNHMDDHLDGLFLQGSSQWDGLRHVRAREFGHYNGFDADVEGADAGRLGIENWAQQGIVGRGVLVDVARYYEQIGREHDPRSGAVIGMDDVQATLDSQGTELRSGDILLLRTGFMKTYLAATTGEERQSFAVVRDTVGLSGGEDVPRFLWDNQIAAIAADNPAIEVVPGDPKVGSLHRRLLPLLGYALGELFSLETLADDCHQDGRYSSYFVAVPLNIPGGVGSPANAIAIK